VEIKDLIESGSLELYVLGALPENEARQIDNLRLVNTEVNDEIMRIEDAMISFAAQQAQKPDAALKNKIAAQLTFAEDEQTQPQQKATPAPETIMVTMVPSFYRYGIAASILLAVALGVSTFYYYSKYTDANQSLLAMRSEQNVMANQVKYQQQETDKVKNQLAVVSNPTNKAVVLKGLPIAPQAQAVVYWNNETGQAYINAANLPQIASNQQYQLWAIVDGKPVDMGVLDKDSTFGVMKDVKGAVAFAITLEPLGGRPTPTLEKMYVLGNV